MTTSPTIAALYVETGGVYYNVPGVDAWDERRDARRYAGPHPVVAHPPCARWGRYATGGPSHPGTRRLGDDGGCFSAALDAVRCFGGVLEHPADSQAWAHFGLNKPAPSGWVAADMLGGWTCVVDQRRYGHRATKATWLYACSASLPSLRWGRVRAGNGKRGTLENLSKKQRMATPVPFRDILIDIARSAV